MRVLLCVDEDPVLESVVDAMRWSLALRSWDDVFVLHVIPKAPPFLARIDSEAVEGAVALVDRIVERLEPLGASIEGFTASGDPAQAIVQAADEYEVDLVVMGARGDQREFPIGSVSQKVVSLADADVLVVREPRRELTSLEESFPTLVSVDGSAGSDAGIQAFATKLHAQHAEIRLVHVVDSVPAIWRVGSGSEPVSASLVRHAEEILARAKGQLEARGLEADGEWEHGSPATQILEVARRHGSELIVVGSLGHSRLAGLMLGTITQRILRHAPCSVFCARGWSPVSDALVSRWSSDSSEPNVGMA